MDSSRKKTIIDSACAFTLEHFRKKALSADEGFVFDAVFDSLEDFFCEEVLGAARNAGLPEGEWYKLYFSGWEEKKRELREQCLAEFTRIQKERTVERIIAVTVETLVEPKIRLIGLPYRLTFQKHRLKVSLLVARKRGFEFYVRYRDMNKSEIIDLIPERTGAVIEYIQTFGPQVRLMRYKTTGDWHYPEKKDQHI